MDKLKIVGGKPLKGDIVVSGSKNAGLPIMTACLLTEDSLTINNMPELADVHTLIDILCSFGADACFVKEKKQLILRAQNLNHNIADYDMVRKMRASILVLGPLLARTGEAVVSLPGGCSIGARPVNFHIQGLEAMGAEIVLEEGLIKARAPNGLKGVRYDFPFPSVTGTENLLMAATLAKGVTEIGNAAKEPEVVDLAHCLNKMGAKISGIGTNTLVVEGVDKLNGAVHELIPDRIEAGSYALAFAITKGEGRVIGKDLPNLLSSFIDNLRRANVIVEEDKEFLKISYNGDIQGIDILTEPFPGYPTDLQAQMMALMSVSQGASMITENIFENRFMHASELMRMGANITIHGKSALVRGVETLKGAPVMATDLRASMSLLLAALAADGETTINRIYHLDRGYEHIEKKLSACGAEVIRIK